MILLFDVETTGLPDFNKRARDPSQPHIVQLAAMLCDDDGKILETYEAIAKPDGWIIPPELEDIHGISTEHARKVGIHEKEILAKILSLIRKARIVAAYNITFDKFLVRIGLRRFDLMTDTDDAWWKGMNTRCVMRPMVDICKLPFKNGGRGFKFPKLQEAYKHAFGREFVGAHNAIEDLKATRDLYFWQVKELKLS